MFGYARRVARELRLEQLDRRGFEEGLSRTGPEPIGGYGHDAEEREIWRNARERGERARRDLREGR